MLIHYYIHKLTQFNNARIGGCCFQETDRSVVAYVWMIDFRQRQMDDVGSQYALPDALWRSPTRSFGEKKDQS